MPYVFVEELAEGQNEADVLEAASYRELQTSFDELQTSLDVITEERDELQRSYDEAVSARDELQRSYDEAVSARDSLEQELGEAKTKFANAFLSSPQKAKNVAAGEVREQETPMTFATLFTERKNLNGD